MTQRARVSPVLGYNHNLRHGGRVFHVQTEDSGHGYARLHTHLFYEGTILSTKKQEYDPSAPEDAVRTLMQQLHKSMIRELKDGAHDTRIGNFFIARGEPPMLDDNGAPAAAAAPAKPAPPPPEAPAPPPAAAVPVRADKLPATAPIMAAPATPSPKPVVMVKPGGVRRPPVVLSSSADGVVVRRNVVINVGGGAPPVNGTPGAARQPSTGTTSTRAKPQAPVAAPEGVVVPSRGGSRAAAAPPETAPQPLASSRDIRMPWESPPPPRPVQPAVTATAEAPRARARGGGGGEVHMPWDPPAATTRPIGVPEAFAGDDKGLDEVILEYLSDDAEPEER